MISSAERRRVVERVARLVPMPEGDACVRVGIDGPDASGKTTFADELAAELHRLGRPVARVSLDDFHHPRAVRYQLGRESPEGFWRHAFNYARFRSDVLDRFGPGGDRRYRPATHDLVTDTECMPAPKTAEAGTVLIVDGLFLHRDEFVVGWDLSVFLDVDFTETAKRMAVRDGADPDPRSSRQPSLQRRPTHLLHRVHSTRAGRHSYRQPASQFTTHRPSMTAMTPAHAAVRACPAADAAVTDRSCPLEDSTRSLPMCGCTDPDSFRSRVLS